MVITPPSYFEEIRQKAVRRWDQLGADPELAGPWHQLFRQVQSPRHVLSELLQNADDAVAKEASVKIEDRAFLFDHDGEDFRPEHFVSLCQFGHSNKRTLHTIGFRGIGFKSTFSLGDRVELLTPTLSVAYHRDRFTQPEWIDASGEAINRTQVRVPIKDERRQREIEKNLEDWFASPVSLLFFRNIRCLRISGREIRWDRSSAGPVPNSEWLEQTGGYGSDKVLLIRSDEEGFPADALEEIRQERLVTDEDMDDFPPCRVEIVQGAPGSLYVVLPTGVQTELPFACNAPFIQDPARIQIKDPEISPTNRWLLDRIGKLAAKAMLVWLGNTDLSQEERAVAYGLLPNLDEAQNSLEAVCGARVARSFHGVIAGRPILLTFDGKLVPRDGAIILPSALFGVWPDRDPSSFLDQEKRPSLVPEVRSKDRRKLIDLDLVEELERDEIIKRLKAVAPPKPENWNQLARLWEYLSPAFAGNSEAKNANLLHLVPVAGADKLAPAESVIRLRSATTLAEEEWVFLAQFLTIADQEWFDWLKREEKNLAGAPDDSPEGKLLARVSSVLKAIELNAASSTTKIIDNVAAALFAKDEISVCDAVRLAHVAAKLGASAPINFQFVVRDGTLQWVDEWIIFDRDGSVESLIPPEWFGDVRDYQMTLGSPNWIEQHFLHDAYFRDFKSCTQEEWERWASSKKSGLRQFVSPKQKKSKSDKRTIIEEELVRRGYKGGFHSGYATPTFSLADWDFSEALWVFWKSLSEEDPKIWQKVVLFLLNQPPDYWEFKEYSGLAAPKTTATADEIAQNGNSRRVVSSGLCPAWALRLRELPCLPDTKGFVRKPNELLRRTAQTEAFLEVEPFVAHELDVEANRPILDLLGVRSVPLGPEAILDRLRALSKTDEPPIAEVEKWYAKLDQAVQTGATEDVDRVRKAFSEEALIFASSRKWVCSPEVFLSANEDDVPEAELIRPSVRNLALWSRLGVADRPTYKLAAAWLMSLQQNEELSSDILRRVRSLLARHPNRIWEECRCWLNLAGELVACSGLSYSIAMQSLVQWKHLNQDVKQRTADFQGLSGAVVAIKPFSTLPSLASRIENRPTGQASAGHDEVKPVWLSAISQELVRVRLDNEDATSRVRALAAQLVETVVRRSPGLELMPYLDNTPAGTPICAEVIWLDSVLYLNNLPELRLACLLPEVIGARFERPEIQHALDFSFDRSPEMIRSYMEQNFRLNDTGDGKPGSPPNKENVAKPETGDEPLGKSPGSPPETALDQDDSEPSPSKERPFKKNEPDSPSKDGPEASDTHPKPTKFSILEQFARASGFSASAEHRFTHPDGSVIVREQGNIIPWERRSPSGEVVCRYWPRDHCLERNPLEIPSEVWGLLKRRPDFVSLILANQEGKPVEVTGEQIVSLSEAQKISLYPATYRLVYQP